MMNFSKHPIFAPLFFLVLFSLFKLKLCTGDNGTTVVHGCPEIEKQSLLSFKQSLHDPSNSLSSWNGNEANCCKWKGVRCSNLTGHVQQLHLQNSDFRGKVSPSLLNLKHLKYLNLSQNLFHERIPSFIGSLTSLEYLDLSGAEFHGNIPHNIGNLSNLHTLSLDSSYYDLSSDSSYYLQVDSLEWLSGLSKLEYLSLNHVKLSRASNWAQQPSICMAGDNNNNARHNSGDDIVIVAAYRTAICKSKRGGFKDTLPDDLLASVLKALVERTNINPAEVGDIVVGTVLAPGSLRAMECRMAAFYAGFPDTVPIRTVNRQCSSGLQAVADVAAFIKAGYYDIGIGAGVESMTVDSMGQVKAVNPKIESFSGARDCLLPMGLTSENVAERFGVTREEQDQAAVISHQRAAAASASGKFKDEIIPVSTKIVDPTSGETKHVTISVDDGIRPNANMKDLAKLKPAFKKNGSTTAGNASQVSDGAGAVLLMKRSLAMLKGLPILGVFRSFAAVGVDPGVMGIGPAVAIPAAVKSAGLELNSIDLFEINEAFASQYVYCRKKLSLDPEKINVNGGAMALGHPLGATGARCVATLLHEMNRRGKDCRFGVISMCIGSGMGAAAVLERGEDGDGLSNAQVTSVDNVLSKDAKETPPCVQD